MKSSKIINCEWKSNSDCFLECFQNSKVVFKDSIDHWCNGFCRLLGFSEEQGKKWVETVLELSVDRTGEPFSGLSFDEKIDILRESSQIFFNFSDSAQKTEIKISTHVGPCGHQANTVWEGKIGKESKYLVVGCVKCNHGWLVERSNSKIKLADPIIYEKDYFEGNDPSVGYGDYMAQKAWRQEKARGLLRRINALIYYFSLNLGDRLNLLDIGSGYGFFRKAVDEAGWVHDGIELSDYAVDICRKEYGFKTFQCSIEEFCKTHEKKYEVITLWDLIEHVQYPNIVLSSVNKLLSDNGVCFVRTPNLLSVEREILGPYYYSLKREHLNYFSPQSLLIFLENSSFVPLFLTSESHFFYGFFGESLNFFANLLKGSDLFVMFRKKSNRDK